MTTEPEGDVAFPESRGDQSLSVNNLEINEALVSPAVSELVPEEGKEPQRNTAVAIGAITRSNQKMERKLQKTVKAEAARQRVVAHINYDLL